MLSLLVLAFPLLAFPLPADAADFSLALEPDVAFPLTAPQSELFDVGGGQSLKGLFHMNPHLAIGPTVSFHLLPAAEPLVEPGLAWGLGGGLRLHGDREEVDPGVSPWLDADLFYLRTGGLNRPGFDAAVGLAVPVGDSGAFWLGPFVRYLQILQPVRDGYDNRDAQVLSLGLSLEVGAGREPAPAPVAATQVAAPLPAEKVAYCPDGDQDQVPDSVDRCPTVVGTVEGWGCPVYQKVVVHKDKLELKEKIYFAFDEATIEAVSFPLLDEVVRALNDHPGLRVQVEGHTDSSGPDAHNQTLSEARAAAVLDYLVAHGVPRERLASKGFSSTVPVDTNTTADGREYNRRVEFVVQFNIINDGSPK